ncbi:MAG: 4-hydroxy-tetrahydrodipicolinate synthase [Planctomycetota bacterium]|nr:4-hydroxy-tetrahydrodipicolinate synthase [Planctomycetota bacterium]
MSNGRFAPGLWVALVTPMTDGEIDHDGLKKLVEFHVESGTTGLVPCGTTGESATFSHSEHQAVVETVIKAAAGRLQIMAGTGSNSTREAVSLTIHAKAAGADGALVITPYYNKPTQGGLYKHFEAVAKAVPDFPICLYNVPGRTCVDLLPKTAAQLAEDFSNIVAFKEATGMVDRVSEMRSLTDKLDVFSGDDALTLPMMSVGAAGVISVAGNIVPKMMLEMLGKFKAGDLAGATACHDRLFPLMKGMFIETNPIPIKAAMALNGQLKEDYRLPMVPPTDETREQVKAILTKLGVL